MSDFHARQNMLLSPKASRMLRNLRVIVFGVGAIGNRVAQILALIGVRTITLVDFDHIEASNLSRTVLFRKEDIGKSKALVAAMRLLEMALADDPVIVGLHGNIMTDFGKGFLFMEHDVAICCVDMQDCRAYINDWCVRTHTPLIETGMEGFNVNVTFFAPADGYEQVSDGKFIEHLPTSDGLFPKVLNDFTVCLREEIGQGIFDMARHSCSGFKMADTELAKIPTIETSGSMAATLAVTELIKYISGKDTLRNKILYYYGLTNKTICCSYLPSEECIIHKENMPIYTLEVSKSDTIRTILEKMREKWDAYAYVQIPSFVISGHCACCGKELKIGKRESEVYNDERWCEECRNQYPDYEIRLDYENQWVSTPFEWTLDSDKEMLELRLEEIGVPEDDIVKVIFESDTGIEEAFVRLHS